MQLVLFSRNIPALENPGLKLYSRLARYERARIVGSSCAVLSQYASPGGPSARLQLHAHLKFGLFTLDQFSRHMGQLLKPHEAPGKGLNSS